MLVVPEVVAVTVLSVFLVLALCAALVLVTLSLRRPTNPPLIAAAAIVVLCLLVQTTVPVNVPPLVATAIALLGVALATVGGNPVTRRVLDIATHGTVRDGERGGILVDEQDAGAEATAVQEVLRGGTTIGYLERLAVALAIVAGYPEAIAVVVALKGIGRFSELATPAARERFIVGTLASLLWACAVAGLVSLAIR